MLLSCPQGIRDTGTGWLKLSDMVRLSEGFQRDSAAWKQLQCDLGLWLHRSLRWRGAGRGQHSKLNTKGWKTRWEAWLHPSWMHYEVPGSLCAQIWPTAN